MRSNFLKRDASVTNKLAQRLYRLSKSPRAVRTLIEKQEDHEESALNRDEHAELMGLVTESRFLMQQGPPR